MPKAQEQGAGNDIGPGGRRYVALLFADLCDSTQLGEALDPEESIAVRRRIESIAEHVIERHGGTLSQVYGDGLLAIFGYPETQEDDARRAVEAALELHRRVRGAALAVAAAKHFELRMHSGVHAGRVFMQAGDILHGRYELIGDAVNTAARLSSEAGRDEILVSEATLGGIEAFFVTEPTAPLLLRGKRARVAAYRVLDRSGVSTRFEARASSGLTGFVGRDRELRALLDLAADTPPGPARIVLVQGAPGIGKSRTLTELRARVAERDTTVLWGSCESYGEMPLLGPFLQVLRQALGLRAERPDRTSAALVQKIVKTLGPPATEHLQSYLRLLGLKPFPDRGTENDRESHQERVGNAMAALFATLGSRRSLLLVLDDWQWADDGSRAVLDRLRVQDTEHGMCIAVGSRILTSPDPALAGATVQTLEPFSEEASAHMIQALRPESPDLGVTHAIHARTGGNPLYLEELCRAMPSAALVGEQALEQSSISTTLHGLIQARVDALPPEQARLLRTASVIGQEFTPSLIPPAYTEGELDRTLHELSQNDLIRETEFSSSFRFKHGITREVIYDTVRLDERRQIHRAIADALAARSERHQSDDQLEMLAYHYRGSGDHHLAARYAEAAGDRARATSSLDRARLQYSNALEELDLLSATSENRRRWLEVYAKWAGVYVYSASRTQLPILTRAAQYATEAADKSARAYTEHWRSWMYYTLGEYDRAIDAARVALALAEEQGDARLKAQLLATLGQSFAAGGEAEEALEHLDRAIEMKRQRSGKRRSQSLLLGFAYAMGARASLRADLGDFEQADQDIAEARAAVDGSGHALESSVGALECMVHIYRGRFEACIEAATRCCAIASRVNSAYVFSMGTAFGAYARFVLTSSPDALDQLKQANGWLEARDSGLYGSFTLSCLAEAAASIGDLECARDAAERALARRKLRDRLGETAALRALARIGHREHPGSVAVAAQLDSAMVSAQSRRSRRDQAVTRLLQAELMAAGDAHAEARARKALSEFEALDMQWHAEQARELLARL
ncbi:MAG: AAA family ATPase [Myxococcales bacterium]|nr:AAA family ATPase [Myxococcales bacterium]